MVLANPGQAGELCEIVARDSFLHSLNDRPLRARILERELRNLDEVLNIACQLRSFEASENYMDEPDFYRQCVGALMNCVNPSESSTTSTTDSIRPKYFDITTYNNIINALGTERLPAGPRTQKPEVPTSTLFQLHRVSNNLQLSPMVALL